MSNPETIIQNNIINAVSRGNVRVFRNNVGQAKTVDGSIIKFGLCQGSSDVIGWTSREITPDMVGKSIAIFTAIEVKTKTGRVSESQQKFIDLVSRSGGIAGIARSIDDAKSIIEGDL